MLTMLGMIIGVGAVITMVALGTRRAVDDRGAGQGRRHEPDQRQRRQLLAGRRPAGPGHVDHADARGRRRRSARCPACSTSRRASTRAARSSPATRTGRRRSRAPTSTCRSSAAGRRSTAASSRRRTSTAPRRSRCSARSSSDTLFGPTSIRPGRSSASAISRSRCIGVMISKGQAIVRPGPGRHDLRAVHDRAEEAAGHQHINNITVSAVTADTAPVSAERSPRRCATRHKLLGSEPDDFMVRTQEEIAERPHRDDQDDDDAAGEHRRRVAARRRHRHHEHHAGVGHRADARDRPAHGDRRARQGRAACSSSSRRSSSACSAGCIGIGMGFGLSALVKNFMQWPTVDSRRTRSRMAFGFAAATGVFFGFYPARKAARLDPIEALRFE